jgi:uncharacterized LabA/DUF88 family protein
MEDEKKRVIIYIDGFNFYFGLKSKNWKKYYWLDIVAFFSEFIKDYQELVEVNYFSAPSIETDKNKRQSLFFSANKLNPKFILQLGYYSSKKMKCFQCGNSIQKHEEKQTDVNIATQIIGNVIKGKSDISILVSADSDLLPPLKLLREIAPTHKVFVYFPPKRYSSELRNFCDAFLNLENYETRFKSNVFPMEVEMPNGFKLKRPDTWV